MNNRKLIITWMPDVLSMVDHNGSFKKKREDNLYPSLWDNNYKGATIRAERESLRVSSKENAEKVLNRRNKSQIQFATYNGNVIYPVIESKKD